MPTVASQSKMGLGYCDAQYPHDLKFITGEANIEDFFGPGSDFQIDSTKPVTVTTQFITADGTDHGKHMRPLPPAQAHCRCGLPV